MNEKLVLQDLLPLDELKKHGNVLLVRHYHEKLNEMDEKNLIEEYQSYQTRKAFRNCKYLVCFLSGERNTGVFYGIYEVVEIKEKDKLPKPSAGIKEFWEMQGPEECFFLELQRINKFDKYKNRLIIDWMVPRGWYNTFGEVIDKLVNKVLPNNFVKDFPGLMNIMVDFAELKKIIKNPDSHSHWYDSLTRLQAIYLIFDKNSGYQYIGTTYGEKGLWQRWETYVSGDGTGGNKNLVALKEKNHEFYKSFQFSILEVLSKTSGKEYCIQKETIWKKKLGSRAYGLNCN